jgi:hypothetical protein
LLPRFGKYPQRACTDFGDARGRRECCRRSAQVWTQPPHHMQGTGCNVPSRLSSTTSSGGSKLRAREASEADNYARSHRIWRRDAKLSSGRSALGWRSLRTSSSKRAPSWLAKTPTGARPTADPRSSLRARRVSVFFSRHRRAGSVAVHRPTPKAVSASKQRGVLYTQERPAGCCEDADHRASPRNPCSEKLSNPGSLNNNGCRAPFYVLENFNDPSCCIRPQSLGNARPNRARA